jgi:hypothetical protein
MSRRRKPDLIEAGKNYRMLLFGARGNAVMHVSQIVGERRRSVLASYVIPHDDTIGSYWDGYTSFLRRVHSEEPNLAN